MLRLLPVLAGLSLVVPAVASAAPFGELPFQPLNAPAFCLQATGAAGELVRQTELEAPFHTATPAGLVPGGVLPTDGAAGCVDVAGWAGGGGVLAFPVISEIDSEMWIRGFLREPGRGWGEPVDVLPPLEQPTSFSFTVSASERGDALVATGSVDREGRLGVHVTRRLPGGAFGAPERVAFRRSADEYSAQVRASHAASGEAVVTWTAKGPAKSDPPELWAAIAPPGAAFGTPQRIAAFREGTPYALAVGADGRALAVFTSAERLVVSERAPGGTFGPPTTIARTDDRLGASPVAVLRPGGGAVVAWTSPLTAGFQARTREQAGAFGPAIALARPKRLEPAAVRIQQRFASAGRPDLVRGLQATADGRVTITWPHLVRRHGIWRGVPGVAIVSFSGAEHETHALAGGLREIESITPVLLADGSRAVAWTDNDAYERRGRLHVAREGSPDAPEPAAPKVTIAPPRSRALRDAEPLILRVSCDAACDVFVQLAGRPEVNASASLPAAGSRRLALAPVDDPIAPRGGGKVRVLVRSSAPGARTETARTLTLGLRPARVVFPPRVLDLTVTPVGDDLIVRWRTAKPARPRSYSAWAIDDGDEPLGSAEPSGRARRTSFEVRIRDARGAAKVTVYAIAENDDKLRETTVEVPG